MGWPRPLLLHPQHCRAVVKLVAWKRPGTSSSSAVMLRWRLDAKTRDTKRSSWGNIRTRCLASHGVGSSELARPFRIAPMPVCTTLLATSAASADMSIAFTNSFHSPEQMPKSKGGDSIASIDLIARAHLQLFGLAGEPLAEGFDGPMCDEV